MSQKTSLQRYSYPRYSYRSFRYVTPTPTLVVLLLVLIIFIIVKVVVAVNHQLLQQHTIPAVVPIVVVVDVDAVIVVDVNLSLVYSLEWSGARYRVQETQTSRNHSLMDSHKHLQVREKNYG